MKGGVKTAICLASLKISSATYIPSKFAGLCSGAN
jgi:hypothetical protein